MYPLPHSPLPFIPFTRFTLSTKTTPRDPSIPFSVCVCVCMCGSAPLHIINPCEALHFTYESCTCVHCLVRGERNALCPMHMYDWEWILGLRRLSVLINESLSMRDASVVAFQSLSFSTRYDSSASHWKAMITEMIWYLSC